jgi:hypothetical protein
MKHGKNPLYSWFPLYGEKWLFGSTRYELDHAERAIFIDLLALANRDNGFIRANEQFAYTIEHLAGMLHADVELVQSTLLKCIEHGKLEKMEDGKYRVISWGDFSLTDRRKRQVVKLPKKRNSCSVSSETPLISSPLISSTLKEGGVGGGIPKEFIDQCQKELPRIFTEGGHAALLADKGFFDYMVALCFEYQDLDHEDEIKGKFAHWMKSPLTKKSNLSLQFRNWFRMARKIEKDRAKERAVGSRKYKPEA